MALPFGSASSLLPFKFAPPSSLNPTSATNFVAAGGRADWVEDQLAAEQKVDQGALAQHNQAVEQFQELDRSTARQSAELRAAQEKRKKELEKREQEAKDLDVTRATLRSSLLPEKMTDTERSRVERTLKEKETALRANAAAELRAKAEGDPYRDEKEGGIFGFGGEHTARAKEIQDRIERLNDPATLTDGELEEFRKLKPESFHELDDLRGSLSKDDEARKAHTTSNATLARAEAIANGLSPEEADAITTPPDRDPVRAHLNTIAAAGKLEREGAELKTRAASIERQRADADSLATKIQEIEDALRAGGTPARLAPLMSQRAQLLGEHQSLSAALDAEAEGYNAAVRAHEVKLQAFNERGATEATTTPQTAAKPVSVESARQHARRLEDGSFETSDPNNLKVLNDAQEKVYWSDPATPAKPEARAATTKATNEALETLREAAGKSSERITEAVERVETRVRLGELSPEAAVREREKAITEAEAHFETESATINQQLNDALKNFSEGKIDAQTLNAVFHAAGHPQTGVERFAEVQADLRKDQEHVAALESVILGKDLGNSDPSLNGTELALLTDIAKWQDIATRNASPPTELSAMDSSENPWTREDSLRASAEAQKKADQLKTELGELRATRRQKLAAELT
ncbi:MAG TPA: hypothetical protein VD994_19995, partial [Prosthecobacter sp.]|nr:hypothetical protein [Prosthecobacter sp.]